MLFRGKLPVGHRRLVPADLCVEGVVHRSDPAGQWVTAVSQRGGGDKRNQIIPISARLGLFTQGNRFRIEDNPFQIGFIPTSLLSFAFQIVFAGCTVRLSSNPSPAKFSAVACLKR